MSVQYSVAVRNAILDVVETTIGASPKLYMYSATPSASCAAADPAGLLLTMQVPADWMAAAASGVKTLLGTWTVPASAGGTALSYRIKDNAGTTCHEQGTVGMSGTDIVLDNNVMAAGQNVTITAKIITAGNA